MTSLTYPCSLHVSIITLIPMRILNEIMVSRWGLIACAMAHANPESASQNLSVCVKKVTQRLLNRLVAFQEKLLRKLY